MNTQTVQAFSGQGVVHVIGIGPRGRRRSQLPCANTDRQRRHTREAERPTDKADRQTGRQTGRQIARQQTTDSRYADLPPQVSAPAVQQRRRTKNKARRTHTSIWPPSNASAKTFSKWLRPAADLGPIRVDTLDKPASFSSRDLGGGLAGQSVAQVA